MKRVGPRVPPTVSVALIALTVGAVAGFYLRAFLSFGDLSARSGASEVRSMSSGTAPAAMAPAASRGRGGNAGGMAVARLVRNLDTIQMVQGKGLTPEQSKRLLPILQEIEAADELSAAEADKKVAAIRQVLTPAQQATLAAMQPQRGGGGGRGSGGGFGARTDPERPFSSAANRRTLEDLIASMNGVDKT